MAGDWKPDRPADNEKLNNIGVVCRENWDTIENAWNGQHTDLATDGTASVDHKYVTLIEQGVTPSAVTDGGVIYTEANATPTAHHDVYFKDIEGRSWPLNLNFNLANPGYIRVGITSGGTNIYLQFGSTSIAPGATTLCAVPIAITTAYWFSATPLNTSNNTNGLVFVKSITTGAGGGLNIRNNTSGSGVGASTVYWAVLST